MPVANNNNNNMTSSSPPTSKRAEDLLYYAIWQRIALFSDELTLFNLGGVAKIFREIVDDDFLWKDRILQGVALAQMSSAEMKSRTKKIINSATVRMSQGGVLRQVDFLLPADVDLEDPKTIESKIDQIEDVVAALIERSRTRNKESFLFDDTWSTSQHQKEEDDKEAKEDKKKRVIPYRLPETFFLTNRSFVRYVAATFIAQLGTGWTILLERDLFLKPWYHPDVIWKFERLTDGQDSIKVLMNGHLQDRFRYRHSRPTSTNQNNQVKPFYEWMFETDEPAEAIEEGLFVDISCEFPTRSRTRGATLDARKRSTCDIKTVKYSDNITSTFYERGQIVNNARPSNSLNYCPMYGTSENAIAWKKREFEPCTEYERPIQTLVSRCVAEAARSRLKELVLVWKIRDAILPKLIWAGASCLVSGMVYLGVKYASGGYATPSEHQLEKANALLPPTPLSCGIHHQQAVNNTSSNISSSSSSPSCRYPFLKRETYEEAHAGWFSFVYPSFWRKCASHMYSLYQFFPYPNSTKNVKENYPVVDYWVVRSVSFLYIVGEVVSIWYWGVGNVTGTVSEYPNERLITSFWKRSLIQFPLDFITSFFSYLSTRYTGILSAVLVALPVSLVYRMSYRIFWFTFDLLDDRVFALLPSFGSMLSSILPMTSIGIYSDIISSAIFSPIGSAVSAASSLFFSSSLWSSVSSAATNFIVGNIRIENEKKLLAEQAKAATTLLSAAASSSFLGNNTTSSAPCLLNNNTAIAGSSSLTDNQNSIPFSSLNWLSVVGSDFCPEHSMEWGFFLGHGFAQLMISTRMFAIDEIKIQNYIRQILNEMFVAIWHSETDKQVRKVGWMKNLFHPSIFGLENKEKGGLRVLIEGLFIQSVAFFIRYVLQEVATWYRARKVRMEKEKDKKKKK